MTRRIASRCARYSAPTETPGETVRAKLRPIVVITSNNEKELPDAFLRRCFFHYIRFPDAETMERIVASHYPAIKPRLVEEALRSFFSLRETPGLKKKPTTSELLDWLKLLLNEDVSPETLREREAKKLIPPLHGALLKNEQDVHLFEKLAFLRRRRPPARGVDGADRADAARRGHSSGAPAMRMPSIIRSR
jgi:MoxR-like ATPase